MLTFSLIRKLSQLALARMAANHAPGPSSKHPPGCQCAVQPREATKQSLAELFSYAAREIPEMLDHVPAVVRYAFHDYSNLCAPVKRKGLIVTLDGAYDTFHIQTIYTAESVPGSPPTLAVKMRIRAKGIKFKLTNAARSVAVPAAAVPPIYDLPDNPRLNKLFPLLEALAHGPFSWLPGLLSGTLHASMWSLWPMLVNAPPE